METRSGLAALGLCLIIGSWSPAWGITFPTDAGVPKPKRVALLGFQDLSSIKTDLFKPLAENRRGKRFIEQLTTFVERRFRREGLVTWVDLGGRLKSFTASDQYRERRKDALDFYRAGVRDYKALQLKSAIRNLAVAKERFERIYYDVVDSHLVADLQLNLALAYLENKQDGAAAAELGRLLELHPERRYRRGYYAPRVEKALANTQSRILRTPSFDNPFRSDKRLHEFMADMKVDVLILGYLKPVGEDLQLRVLIYERKTREFAVRETINISNKLGEAEISRTRDRLDRIASQWAACTIFELVKPKRPEVLRKRFYFDTNFGYGIYIRHGTRRLYHNVGADIGFSYQFKENFSFFVRFSIYGAAKDPDQDLLASFESFRAMVGPGFTFFPSRRFRIFIHPGLEFDYIGNFIVSSDANCKFFGRDAPPCNQDSITRLPTHFVMALNLAVGFQVVLVNYLYLNVYVDFAGFIVPLETESILNFPLFAHVGLGYKF